MLLTILVGLCAVILSRAISHCGGLTTRDLSVEVLISLLACLVTAVWIQTHAVSLSQATFVGIGVSFAVSFIFKDIR